VAQDPDEKYRVLPVGDHLLRFRVQADAARLVWVDTTKLPRRQPGDDQDGWFDFGAEPLVSGNRTLFYDVLVELPSKIVSLSSPA
jgi:hypothetical protein